LGPAYPPGRLHSGTKHVYGLDHQIHTSKMLSHNPMPHPGEGVLIAPASFFAQSLLHPRLCKDANRRSRRTCPKSSVTAAYQLWADLKFRAYGHIAVALLPTISRLSTYFDSRVCENPHPAIASKPGSPDTEYTETQRVRHPTNIRFSDNRSQKPWPILSTCSASTFVVFSWSGWSPSSAA
jgi:hypothetical protein